MPGQPKWRTAAAAGGGDEVHVPQLEGVDLCRIVGTGHIDWERLCGAKRSKGAGDEITTPRTRGTSIAAKVKHLRGDVGGSIGGTDGEAAVVGIFPEIRHPELHEVMVPIGQTTEGDGAPAIDLPSIGDKSLTGIGIRAGELFGTEKRRGVIQCIGIHIEGDAVFRVLDVRG